MRQAFSFKDGCCVGEREWAEARNWGIVERDPGYIQVKALMVGDMGTDRNAAANANVEYLPVENFELETVENLRKILER
ncbi:MAG: hypothetical protein AAF959_18670 [Cyanobacteria bacterium P01_D01_bin.56]